MRPIINPPSEVAEQSLIEESSKVNVDSAITTIDPPDLAVLFQNSDLDTTPVL